ncbi:MAG: hypothetical protein M3Q22_09085 [Actinomycetota bacterium]|nr:hypothetical protein [Actinomycetota bacterium]
MMRVTLHRSPTRPAQEGAPVAWRAGWWVGGAVVVISAGLLLTLIGYARRIARQADEIAETLQATRRNTAPLFDLAGVNAHLDRIVAPSEAGR